ncbi:hypothetical protein [Compostibacter hankyongensis]|uniref:Uncharacterized protein n=1 Tax=Compostibacter hankyongensis TaxID=1007089 RepID=A0ABP8FEB5_9BACT
MDEKQSLETLSDIKRIMERSSRFLSLSGWSGVAAGICGLAGAAWGQQVLLRYQGSLSAGGQGLDGLLLQTQLIRQLFLVAGLTFFCALVSVIVFTWLHTRRRHLPVWNAGSRRLLVNLFIPLIAGGIFLLGMLYRHEYHFIGAGCLVFYGLALVNAGKYTLTDIRYLGLLEILLGLVCLFFESYTLYFCAFGFGLLHIVYGLIMWKKYKG